MRSLYRKLTTFQTALRIRILRMKLRHLGLAPDIDGTVRFDHPDRVTVGDRVRIAHCSVIRANGDAIALADDCFVQDFCLLNANAGSIRVGQRSWLGAGSHIYGNGSVTIGNDVLIAAQTVINTVSHNHGDLLTPITDQGINVAPVVIEDNVWVGAGARILQGVTIGTGAIIGAGSLVNRDVPPNSIVYGTPARVAGYRSMEQAA